MHAPVKAIRNEDGEYFFTLDLTLDALVHFGIDDVFCHECDKKIEDAFGEPCTVQAN
jgi:hypothetical protein